MRKIIFLRGNSLDRYIGSTDIEIAFSLRTKYKVYILMRKPSMGTRTNYINDINIIYVPYFPVPLIGAFLFNLMAYAKILAYDFDVLITNPGLFISSLLYKISKRESKNVLDIRSIPVDSNRFRLFINYRLLRYTLTSRFIDGITIITEPMARYLSLEDILPPKTPLAFWGSGVNKSLFKPMEKQFDNYPFISKNSTIIIYHGGLAESRGLINLLDAINFLIKDKCNEVRLILIGDGKDLNKLKYRAKLLEIDDYVTFTGLVPYEDIPKMISIADLAVLPFPNNDWWSYQSPLKIFEYLSVGIPIIATDLPAHRNISKGVILIKDNLPTTICEAIKSFIKLDISERRILSENAIADSAKYTWDAQAKLFSEFLDKEIL